MVRWMVAVLLRLAPDLDIDPLDDNEENRNSGIGATIISESMTAEIQDRARLQFRHLRKLTNTLYHCCKGIVSDDVNEQNGDEGQIVGIDKQDLNKIKVSNSQDFLCVRIFIFSYTSYFEFYSKINPLFSMLGGV